MNWPVLIVVGIICLGIIVFTIIRNQKDEKEFEGQVKDDYPKPKYDQEDSDSEETPK